MKNRVVTTLMAATLCTAMLGSTAFAASFTGELGENDLTNGVEVEGDSGLENPVYKIAVPTQLEFAVDPFEQKGQSQVYSKDFYMINKSNVPVQLDCGVTLSIADGSNVVIKDAAGDVTEVNTDKLIYMEAEIPSAVTEENADPGAYTPALKKDDNSNDVFDATKVPGDITASDLEDMVDTTGVSGTYTTNKKVGLGTTEKKLSFALEKAAYQQYFTANDKSTEAKQFKAVAASQAGSAAFRFSGKVNTKATWNENDIHAKVKYTFNGLTGTNYDALVATPDATAHAYVAGNQNVVESDGTNDIVIYYTGTKPASVTIAPLQTTGSATSAMTKSNGSEVVIDNDKVTLKAAFLDGIIKNTQRGKGTYKVTIGSVDTTVTLK